MIGYEEKELMAAILDNAADQLGRACNIVDSIARRDVDTVRAVPDEADLIVIDGPAIIKALRALSRRYVR